MTEARRQEGGKWGKGGYPDPRGIAFIECDEMKCTGCGICQMACSIRHFGVINKDLSRIQVRKYLLPLSKGIQMTCSQCQDEERQCQPACPVDPPAIYFDSETLHMVIDNERCLGESCLKCREACSSRAIRNHPELSPLPFVCDLCDTANDGNRHPQCVEVCPTEALYYKTLDAWGYSIRDFTRKHLDEKARLIASRLYPLTRDKVWEPEEEA